MSSDRLNANDISSDAKIIVKAIQISYDSGLMTDLDLNIHQINCSVNYIIVLTVLFI